MELFGDSNSYLFFLVTQILNFRSKVFHRDYKIIFGAFKSPYQIKQQLFYLEYKTKMSCSLRVVGISVTSVTLTATMGVLWEAGRACGALVVYFCQGIAGDNYIFIGLPI